MGVFDSSIEQGGHEQVVFCTDEQSGLRAIIAIASTALGPALGGTRFYPYESETDALHDVLDLSRAMAYKASLAGLDLGGGKAVIIGDPATMRSEALLRAYGRFVQSLGGRYLTACDVGTYPADMDLVARECDFVTGRTVEHGGAGDSSILTAFGVFQGMRACAEAVWGAATLNGRRVGIEGVGKVGGRLAEMLLDDGAEVSVCDVSASAVATLQASHPAVAVVRDTAELLGSRIDVFAPCALGGSVTDDLIASSAIRIVCGAANNQLGHAGIDKTLAEADVLWAPDYCVNSGGLIQVADELEGFRFERAKQRAAGIFETTARVLHVAATEQITPGAAADRVAERRITEIGRLRGMWLPSKPLQR